MPGRPWRFRPSRTRFGASPRIGYASRPNGQLTAEVLHLLDPQPCWLLQGFFSKLARSVLRHIRVESKEELKDRLTAAMDYFNQEPVVHTWSYGLDRAK